MSDHYFQVLFCLMGLLLASLDRTMDDRVTGGVVTFLEEKHKSFSWGFCGSASMEADVDCSRRGYQRYGRLWRLLTRKLDRAVGCMQVVGI